MKFQFGEVLTATAGQFDGLVTLATADATVIDVVGEAVTAANVIAEMGLLLMLFLLHYTDKKIYIFMFLKMLLVLTFVL
jgi:hypothetical protein